MAFHRRLSILFLLLTTATVTSSTRSSAPSPSYPATITTTAKPPPRRPQTRPPSAPHSRQSQDNQVHNQQQLNNIIDALIGAGDFTSWANVLSATGPTTLPLSATFFIPSDDSVPPPTITTAVEFDPFIFPYHIVPQRLTFSELRQFKIFSRLPTLLSKKSILITNNSLSNFTLDDCLLSRPDLYSTSKIAVHGIDRLLDYSVYGNPVSMMTPPQVIVSPRPPGSFIPEGELISDRLPSSHTARRCTSGWRVFVLVLVVYAVLGSKLEQRMRSCPLRV